jgi:hypothetical protein
MIEPTLGAGVMANKVLVSPGDLGGLRSLLDACIDKAGGAARRDLDVPGHEDELVVLLQHAACKVDQMTCQAQKVREFVHGQMVVLMTIRGLLHMLRLLSDPMAPEYQILSNAEIYARRAEVEMVIHRFGWLSAEGFAQLETLWPGFEGPARHVGDEGKQP